MANRNHDAANSGERSSNSTPPNDDAQHTLRSNARRRLDFGSNEVSEDAFQQLQAEDWQTQRQKAIEKWNFDFENEVPLPGDWEWEKMPVSVPDNKEVITSMVTDKEKNRNV